MDAKSIVIAAAVVLLGAGSPVVYAQTEQAAPEGQPAAVEVGNKFCPVSKEKVGEMGDIVKYEYNGKIYNFCCKACLKDFAKDPGKFAKIAEEEVAASQDQPAEVR